MTAEPRGWRLFHISPNHTHRLTPAVIAFQTRAYV